MSSKFFTWTKGDRRNASEALRSGGVIPIPVECISIKGLDYSRSTKGSSRTRRKPIPLRLDSGLDTGLDYNGRAEKSVALHDAAVQSATSLMAVMNDMLRSPHMSTHLQQYSGGLQPMYGRPRSHTAPSTPMAEAPVPEPAELPGSSPTHQMTSSCVRQSIDSKSIASASYSKIEALGRSIERPSTSPQGSTYPPMSLPRQSTESAPPAGYLFPPPSTIVRTPDTCTKRSSEGSHQSSFPEGEDTLVATDTVDRGTMSKRPSLSVLQPWPSNVQDNDLFHATTANHNMQMQQRPPICEVSAGALPGDGTAQADTETALLGHISILRASHEAHLASLKETHERELKSQRTYIALLEKRRGLSSRPTALPCSPRRQLTIDTSHAPGRLADPLTSDASATTMNSIESSVASHKRVSQEAIAEAELLKRKLSLARRSQSDTGEIRRERDQLRDSVDRSDRRILQLKDIVRKAKENEKALKNAADDLHAKLLAANNERLDVREGYHEACEQVKKLTERERTLVNELNTMRGRAMYANASVASLSSTHSDNTHDHRKHNRARSDAGLKVLSEDATPALLRKSKQEQSDLELRMQSLLQEVRRHRDDDIRFSESRRQFEAIIERQQRALEQAERDRDSYNTLLHNELRRQTRQAMLKAPNGTPPIDAQAFAMVAEKIASPKEMSVLANDMWTRETRPGEESPAALKKELEHCVKEIIMYKLDVKGYKKDLKRANAELELLRATKSDFPPTPDRDSQSSNPGHTGSHQRRSSRSAPSRNPSHPGLGISLTSPPKTPTRKTAPITSEHLLKTPPPPFATASKSPPSPRTNRTPVATHKKLPKPPPSRTPSPMAVASPFRQTVPPGETPRSLSESIISLYGKRGTPEQCAPTTPLRAGCSSDPIRLGSGFGGQGVLAKG